MLHNFNHADRVLDHVGSDDAEAVIVVPEWRNRPFWRRIESGACLFGSEPLNSRLRVMRTVKHGTSAVKHKHAWDRSRRHRGGTHVLR